MVRTAESRWHPTNEASFSDFKQDHEQLLVIVSVSRLDNDRIEIRVSRPQHDSNLTHNYRSEREVRAVLSDFGISEETIASHLKLLAQMGAYEQLNFPPMDVPQNDLLSRGFRL